MFIPSDSCINKDVDESNSYYSSHDIHAISDEMSEKPDSGELDIANIIKLALQDITDEVKCMLIKKRLPNNCEKKYKIFQKKLEKKRCKTPSECWKSYFRRSKNQKFPGEHTPEPP